MKNCYKIIPVLFTIAALSGCSTPESSKENVLSAMQKNTYLSHTKPLEQFGFRAFPTENGVSFKGNARLHPNHMAQTKYKNTLPVITMRGTSRRRSINVLLDTSSTSSWIEFLAAQEMNAYFLGVNDEAIPYRGKYNTGKVDAYASVISHMRINQLFIENIPLYTRMAMDSLGPLARGIHTPQVDMVLGYDTLRKFESIQFNPKKKTITFSATTPYTPSPNIITHQARIIHLRGNGLMIEGSIDGQPLPIVLDFAGDYYFARGDQKVNITKQVSLGEVVYKQVPTLLLPAHKAPPRVGRKLLNRYVITICNHEGIVYFERILGMIYGPTQDEHQNNDTRSHKPKSKVIY